MNAKSPLAGNINTSIKHVTPPRRKASVEVENDEVLVSTGMWLSLTQGLHTT